MSKTIGIRVTPDIDTRIEAYRSRVNHENPGVEITTSDAARALLLRGLDAVEGGAPTKPGKPHKP